MMTPEEYALKFATYRASKYRTTLTAWCKAQDRVARLKRQLAEAELRAETLWAAHQAAAVANPDEAGLAGEILIEHEARNAAAKLKLAA